MKSKERSTINLIENNDNKENVGRPWHPQSGAGVPPGTVVESHDDEGYEATKSSSLRRRRSVKISGKDLDIASQWQASGYEMRGAGSDGLTPCVSFVSNAVLTILDGLASSAF